jgi:hypothetical protein
MRLKEIIEGVSTAFKRLGTKNVRKFRCKSGPRKGRVMASPASCNAPLKSKKSAKLRKTKTRLGKQRSFRSNLTRRRNPASRRLKQLNR